MEVLIVEEPSLESEACGMSFAISSLILTDTSTFGFAQRGEAASKMESVNVRNLISDIFLPEVPASSDMELESLVWACLSRILRISRVNSNEFTRDKLS